MLCGLSIAPPLVLPRPQPLGCSLPGSVVTLLCWCLMDLAKAPKLSLLRLTLLFVPSPPWWNFCIIAFRLIGRHLCSSLMVANQWWDPGSPQSCVISSWAAERYSLHSLRFGTAATAALHLPTMTLKSLGRWSSSAFQRYIRLHKKEILSAQKLMSSCTLKCINKYWQLPRCLILLLHIRWFAGLVFIQLSFSINVLTGGLLLTR